MPGLLDGVLPYIYSRSNAMKRQISGLLSDPMGSIEQTVGLLQDKHREQQALMSQAFANPAKPFGVTDHQALSGAVNNMMSGPMGFAPAGITAWHGTPHMFDKFDSSKIGTGEGAQAYGHGLYLAENPAVAKQYADNVMPVSPLAIKDAKSELLSMEKEMANYGGSSRVKPSEIEAKKAYIQRLFDRSESKSLYKVDLPDDKVARMLDWDKPLSQQPAASKYFKEMHEFNGGKGYVNGDGGYTAIGVGSTDALTGKDLVNYLSGVGGGRSDSSALLRQQGIPGIRYLDGGSRAAGGTSNFVVFPGEESALKILERNGQSLR